MNHMFAYTDEDDKCLGLVGMVISLDVFDNEDMLLGISLDDANGNSISFTPDFFFSGNPRFSAKIAWNEMIKQYQLLTAMVVGNVMCRYNVGKHKPLSQSEISDMRQIVVDEGHDMCSLEDDEIDMIYDKTVNYLQSVYTNNRIQNVARGIAQELKQRRTLSGNDLIEELQYLRRR